MAIDLGVVSGANQSHGPRGPRAQEQTDLARSVRQTTDRTSFALAPTATKLHPKKPFCFRAGMDAPNLKNGLAVQPRRSPGAPIPKYQQPKTNGIENVFPALRRLKKLAQPAIRASLRKMSTQ
jgi:hypothetical protein